jgi:hypothetical protein
MALGLDTVSSVSNLLTSAIDKIWPNPEDKAKAEVMMITAAAESAVRELEAAQAVMNAEAKSKDPWTSRARPSFLYVIYTLILSAIPMGVLFACNPDVANNVITGFNLWLAAIPDSFVQLFGVGYLGYTGARSFDKLKK